MAIELILTEEDFAGLDIEGSGILGDEEDEAVRRAVFESLPGILRKRLQQVWGSLQEYSLEQIEIEVTLKGSPFNVGIEGKMKLTYRVDDST